MTTTTQSTRKKFGRSRAGFTLAELMISASLSLVVMAGVLTTFLYIVRTGVSTTSYTDMENQSRKGLELFARDARMAKNIVWNSATSITLTIPTSGADATYLYQYDATAGTFSRTCTSAGTAAETLISGITASSFSLQGYKLTTDPVTHYPYIVDMSNLSQASVDTKQLQLTMSVGRSTTTVAGTSSNVISARFILRNKHVTT